MNRIYRLVWNQVRGAWIPVAENAKRRGKSGRTSAASAARALATALSLAVVPLAVVPPAVAAPGGAQVVSGIGSINQAGNTTNIQQSSPNLSINWQTFNIAPQETVNFLQPSAAAIAVNRISGNSASQILGHLSANGQVYLINPNGILFGKGAEVNVGGLVASTLDLNDAGFVGSARSFSGSAAGSVVNQGTIAARSGGYVALLGNRVSNQGVITAKLGTVALGAGSAATLTFSGNRLLHVQVDRSVFKSLADNGGLLQADGGQVVMTAGAKDALLASAVNNTGVIEARTVKTHDGEITLLGGMAAGTVNVGGTLDASAPEGGSGGHIDTSAAHVHVTDDAKVTTASSTGLYGSWLIDPQDFTVAASGGDLSGATLSANLDTTGVTLQSANGSHAGSGNIDVNDKVLWSADTSLTLIASNNVNVNANLTATGALAGIAISANTANGSETASGTGTFNLGAGAMVSLPNVSPTSSTALVIGGTPYTVINKLGAAGSITGTDLQGVGGSLSGHYALGSNIDATATSTWNSDGASTPTYAGFTPIGNSTTPFTGTFDGLGHVISNLTINQPTKNAVGLFGYISSAAALRNLGLIGGSVSGSEFVGALVGADYGGSISKSYAGTSVSGAGQVGGLVGFEYGGTVSSSYATGSVKSAGNWIGGLLGYSFLGTVDGSYATGTVSGANYVGGLVGYNHGTVSNGYSTGRVSGANYVGGLVGFIEGNYQIIGTVSQSYATGRVSGASNIGGLVGGSGGNYGGLISASHATGSVSGGDNIGGLVGLNGGGKNFNYGTVSTVTNSYATGSVSGGDNIGGLVGLNAAIVSGSHATGSVTGTNYVGGLVGYNGGWSGTYRTVDTIGTIDGSYATGSVSGTNYVGGLAGFNGGGNGNYGVVGTVSNSYATGSVTGTNYVGGLVGASGDSDAVISNSYTTGSVSGANYVGGLVGFNGVGPVGGAFYGPVSTVSNSYAMGNVTGSSNVGGLVGYNSNSAGLFGIVSSSFWNVTTSGQSTSAGGTPLTTAQMQSAANFTGFHFTATPGATGNNWVMVDTNGTLNNAGGAAGATFPMLASEYSTVIDNAHQLQLMAMNTAASYTLGQNINAAATRNGADVWGSSGFVPIGNSSTAFSGVFDGQDHAITSLTIDQPTANDVGLFGHIGSAAVVRNVGLIDSRVSGFRNVGALVGFVDDAAAVSDSYATGGVSGASSVGGLVGENEGGVGNSRASSSVIGTSNLGGLVGWNRGGTIDNSYATGSVSGANSIGGLVGYNNNGGKIDNTYAMGRVTGSSAVGGLVGYEGVSGDVSNGFWNVTTSGLSTSAGGTPLTTAQMQSTASFTGFHFTTTPGASGNNWVIVDGNGTLNNAGGAAGATFPMLASEYSASITSVHQLQLMAMDTAASYTLARSMNAAATGNGSDVWGSSGFVPIGNSSTPFSGTFDGLEHTISNVTINQPTADDVGLIGYADSRAVVRNLGLIGGAVSGSQHVGALVGFDAGSVSNSYATGRVSGDRFVGGLVGENEGSVSNSYARNSVTGSSDVGGLVGWNDTGSVSDSYAAGSVSGASNVGGLVGSNTNGGTVSNSFWDVTTSGQAASAGGTGMTTPQMQAQANFTSATPANGNVNPGWDFNAIWIMYDGHSYPVLRVE
jgi:filamentous hemagglutinin family protein